MKTYILKAFILITTFATVLVACGGDDDDYRLTPGSGSNPSGTPSKMTIMVTGDGYSAADIESGLFQQDVEAFKRALFAYEPMRSMEDYFDIRTIVLTSNESGITTEKHDTALKCYMSGKGSSNIYGDSIKAREYTIRELKNVSGGQTTENMDNTTMIVLLNTDIYGGVTLMSEANAGKSSIASGYALSYIPVRAKIDGISIFTELIQHEVVGHAIAKLGDEYFYDQTATTEVESNMKRLQEYGYFSNIHLDKTAKDDKVTYNLINGTGTHDVFSHNIESSCELYAFANDSRYAAEGLKWYRGAYTYNKDYYRPTQNLLVTDRKTGKQEGFISLMDGIKPNYTMMFNVISRLAIYKRVMRVANGSSWTFDIKNSNDLDAFIKFDAPSRNNYISANAAATRSNGATPVVVESDVPLLTSPKIVKY